jgi:hypothetical protein
VVRRVALIAALFASRAAIASAGEPPKIRYEPQPDWVRTASIAYDARGSSDQMSNGVYLLLDDWQVRVKDRGLERYHRRARSVVAQPGVEIASKVQVAFDPSYEQLSIHHVTIVRGSERIDGLRKEAVKLIHDEPELSARLYNGRITALLFIEDVRQGDAIDLAYTVRGQNPALRGKFTDETSLGGIEPAAHLRYRLLWPTARPLAYAAYAIDLQAAPDQIGDQGELVWQRFKVPAALLEDRIPSWHEQLPWLQVSEFETWADVAAWAMLLFREVAISKELEQQIDRFRAEKDEPARFLAALRFVQRDIRYLGIEMGHSSYEPSDPSRVFSRRFGDCKDKAYLLSIILGRMGIEAHPALVSTHRGGALVRLLPSSTLFNHAIVAAQVQGRTLFVDATDSSSRGGIADLPAVPYGRALIIARGTTDLVEIPASEPTGRMEVEETFSVHDYNSPVRFDVVSRFSGRYADRERARLASISRDDLLQANLNFYARRDRKIKTTSPTEVNDDEASNVITMNEHYVIDDFWNGVRHTFYGYTIDEALVVPQITLRSAPLAVPHPVSIRHTTKVRVPDSNWDIDDNDSTIEGDAFRFSSRTRFHNREISRVYEIVSKSDAIDPEKVPAYLAEVHRVRDEIDYWLSYRMSGRRSDPRTLAAAVGIIVFGVAFLFGYPRLKDWMSERPARVRRDRFRAKFRHGNGESPETAIDVEQIESAREHVAARRCAACKRRSELTTESSDELLFQDQRLSVYRLRCGKCSHESRVYFRLP